MPRVDVHSGNTRTSDMEQNLLPAVRLVCADVMLHEYIRTNQFDVFEHLLKAGADTTARGDDGRTALMMAASLYHGGRYVSALLAANADVESVDELGETALFYACKTPDNIGNARLLLEAKTNVNYKNEEGISPLVSIINKAAHMRTEPPLSMVKLLLWHNADQNQVCPLSSGDYSAARLARDKEFVGLYTTMCLYNLTLSWFGRAVVLRRKQDMMTHARLTLRAGTVCFFDRSEASACRAAGDVLVLECLNEVQREYFLDAIDSMCRPPTLGEGVIELILGYMARMWEPSLWR